MSKHKVHTVEVLEQHSTDSKPSLVELVTVYAADNAEQAVQWVIRGIVSSSYGQNYTRYGYRGYEKGKAGVDPKKEFHVEVPWLRGRAPAADVPLRIGEAYNVAFEQRGLKSKSPWVALTFAHRDTVGKIKTETTAADGKNYIQVRLSGFEGFYLFRIEDTQPVTLGGGPQRAVVSLFAILVD